MLRTALHTPTAVSSTCGRCSWLDFKHVPAALKCHGALSFLRGVRAQVSPAIFEMPRARTQALLPWIWTTVCTGDLHWNGCFQQRRTLHEQRCIHHRLSVCTAMLSSSVCFRVRVLGLHGSPLLPAVPDPCGGFGASIPTKSTKDQPAHTRIPAVSTLCVSVICVCCLPSPRRC